MAKEANNKENERNGVTSLVGWDDKNDGQQAHVTRGKNK